MGKPLSLRTLQKTQVGLRKKTGDKKKNLLLGKDQYYALRRGRGREDSPETWSGFSVCVKTEANENIREYLATVPSIRTQWITSTSRILQRTEVEHKHAKRSFLRKASGGNLKCSTQTGHCCDVHIPTPNTKYHCRNVKSIVYRS